MIQPPKISKPLPKPDDVPTRGAPAPKNRGPKKQIDGGRCQLCNKVFIVGPLYRDNGTNNFYCKPCLFDVQEKYRESSGDDDFDSPLEIDEDDL